MPIHIDEARRQEIKEAVIETLMLLGIDVTTTEGIHAFRKDSEFIREWRISVEEVKKKSLLTAVSFLTAGFLGYLIVSFSRLWIPNAQ